MDGIERSLKQDRADQELALQLEKIREEQETFLEGRRSSATSQRYRKALSDAGLEPVANQEQTVAKRIAASAIRDYLRAALDDLARRAWPNVGTILTAARMASDDDAGKRLRDDKLWTDREALEALTQEILRTPDLGRFSPQALGLLAWLLGENDSNPERLLRQA